MAKTFLELIEQVKGILGVGNGGTGKSSNTINTILIGNGTSPLQELAPGADGTVVKSQSGVFVVGTPSGGTTQRTFSFFVS